MRNRLHLPDHWDPNRYLPAKFMIYETELRNITVEVNRAVSNLSTIISIIRLQKIITSCTSFILHLKIIAFQIQVSQLKGK